MAGSSPHYLTFQRTEKGSNLKTNPQPCTLYPEIFASESLRHRLSFGPSWPLTGNQSLGAQAASSWLIRFSLDGVTSPRLPSNPLITRVPFFLTFGFNKETPEGNRAKGHYWGSWSPCSGAFFFWGASMVRTGFRGTGNHDCRGTRKEGGTLYC